MTPFGRCSCNKKKSCSKYINLGEWSKMSTGTEINNKKSILSTSTITCQEGGTIIILDPKNKTFNN
ncbi:MAG: PAAR-like protein [Fusobacterium ulcerans]|uniref:PAAR-like protein n=1 Tax=Fusobacterium ulcerans TaxID=861 RepID=UPI003A87E5E8